MGGTRRCKYTETVRKGKERRGLGKFEDLSDRPLYTVRTQEGLCAPGARKERAPDRRPPEE